MRSEFARSVSGNQLRGKWLQSKSRLTGREASNIMFLTAEMDSWGGKLRVVAKTGVCAFLAVPEAASREAQGCGGGGLGEGATKWNVVLTEKRASALWCNKFCERMSSSQ